MEGAGGIGGLLAASKKTGTSIDLGYLYDGNGNVTQLFDLSDGSEEGHYEYDPFGKEIVASGNQSEWNKFRFSTKYLEDVVLVASNGSEMELYYYGYRYYSPRLGRWITRDPIGERGGINLHNFVSNTPISKTDPLGEKITDTWCEEFKKDCFGNISSGLGECIFKAYPGIVIGGGVVSCISTVCFRFARHEIKSFGVCISGCVAAGVITDLCISGVCLKAAWGAYWNCRDMYSRCLKKADEDWPYY